MAMFSEALFDVFGEEEEPKEERKKKRTRPESVATREKDLANETKRVRLDLETELDEEEEESGRQQPMQTGETAGEEDEQDKMEEDG